MQGVNPVIRNFRSFSEEVDAITDFVKNHPKTPGSICLVARTNQLLKSYGEALSQNGIPLYTIKRSVPEDRRAEGLRLATMHRVKGLEFDTVIIAGVSDGIVPFEKSLSDTLDSTIRKSAEIQERSLLYVSATRPKRELLITSFDMRHGKLREKPGCPTFIPRRSAFAGYEPGKAIHIRFSGHKTRGSRSWPEIRHPAYPDLRNMICRSPILNIFFQLRVQNAALLPHRCHNAQDEYGNVFFLNLPNGRPDPGYPPGLSGLNHRIHSCR